MVSFRVVQVGQIRAMIYLTNPFTPPILGSGETIEDLAEALLLRPHSRFLVLAYYGDDSGSHGKGPFVVAGYLGTTEDWFYLENEWRKILATAPAITYFKMSECYWLKDEFHYFSRTAANRKLSQFVDAVCLYAPRFAEISSVTNWDEYESAIGDGALQQVFNNPYFFSLHGVIAQVGKFLKKNNAVQPVHFTFDHQSNLNYHSGVQYGLIREKSPKEFIGHMGGISHEDDREFVPLQIADLIAWHVRRDWAKPPEDGGTMRPELKRLRDHTYRAECAVLRTSKIAQMAVDFS
jgi:hypothetical protein